MKEKSEGHGVIVLAISSIMLKLLSSLYMPILSQILTDDGVAIYSIGYDVLIFLFALTSISFQPVITKLVSEQKAKGLDNNALKIVKISNIILFIYSGIISLIFVLLAKPLSILLNSDQSMMVFIFLAPVVLISSILSVYRGFFQGYSEMIILSKSNVFEQALNVIFSILFAYMLIKISIPWGSVGGTVGTTIGAIGALIYTKYVFNKKYKDINLNNSIKIKNDSNLDSITIFKKLFISVVPFILIAAIQNLSAIIDVFTVRTFIEVDININTSTLRYFSTIINVPLVIITSLGIGIFPKIIKGYVNKNKEELVFQTSYFYKLTYMVTIPSVFGLILLSKDIFKFLYNREFGYEILSVGAILLIFISISSIQNIILQGMNKFKFIITIGLVCIIVKTIGNIIFINIDSLNVIGAIIGSIISFFLVTVANHIALQKYFKVNIPILKQSKLPLIASAVMASVIFLLRYKLFSKFIEINYTRLKIGIVTIALVLIGGFIYFLTLLLLGGITKYELDMISPMIYKALPYKLRQRVVE